MNQGQNSAPCRVIVKQSLDNPISLVLLWLLSGRQRPKKSVRGKDISGWHVAFILIKLKSNGRFPAPMDYELGV